MKRPAGIFFIATAVLILVLHSVFPHHHHLQQVCLKSTHCLDDQASHQHNHKGPSHEHDNENSPQHCVLKQDMAAPAMSRMALSPDSRIITPLAGFQAVLFNLLLSAFPQVTASPGFSPGGAVALHACFLTRSHGLRAPPRS